MTPTESHFHPDLLADIRKIYEEHPAGCCLHLALDDGNMRNDHLAVCLAAAIESEHGRCKRVAEALFALPMLERAALYRSTPWEAHGP